MRTLSILSWRHWLLTASFLPLLVKSIDYWPLGRYLPAGILVGMVTLVLFGLRHGGRASLVSVRFWASLLAAWGLVRLALYFTAPQLNEAHLMSQMTTWYLLLSVGHIATGLVLFRSARALRLAKLDS